MGRAAARWALRVHLHVCACASMCVCMSHCKGWGSSVGAKLQVKVGCMWRNCCRCSGGCASQEGEGRGNLTMKQSECSLLGGGIVIGIRGKCCSGVPVHVHVFA